MKIFTKTLFLSLFILFSYEVHGQQSCNYEYVTGVQDRNICGGDTIHLSSYKLNNTGPKITNRKWSVISGSGTFLTPDTSASVSVVWQSSGKLQVVLGDSVNNCYDTVVYNIYTRYENVKVEKILTGTYYEYVGSDSDACKGSVAYYKASPILFPNPLQYSWSVKGGTYKVDPNSDAIIEVTWGADDTGSIELSIEGSCPRTIQKDFKLHDYATGILPDTTVCYGEKFTVSVPAIYGYKYLWSTGHTNSSVNLYPQESGFISVYAKDTLGLDYGCDIRDSFYLTVLPRMNLNINGPQMACYDTGRYSASMNDTSYHYTWTVKGGKIVANDSSAIMGKGIHEIKIDWSNSDPNRSVFVEVQNDNGCKESGSLTVGYSVINTVLDQLIKDTTSCPGKKITLFGPSHQNIISEWRDGSNVISTSRNVEVAPTQATTYTLYAKDTVTGCERMEDFTVKMGKIKLELINSDSSCRGAKERYYINSLDTALTYNWYVTQGSFANGKDSIQLAGGWYADILWDSAPESDTGLIVITVAAPYAGCYDTIYKEVRLFKPANASFTYKQECGSKRVWFKNTSTNAAGYYWEINGTKFTDSVDLTYTFQNFKNNRVYLTAFSNKQCYDYYNLSDVDLDSVPGNSIYAVDTICKGGFYEFQIASGGNQYTWWNAETGDTLSSNTINPASSALYYVQIKRQSGCTYIDSTYIYLDPALSCVWPGDVDGNLSVDVDDPLYLAVALGATGASRKNPSNEWNAQTAADWSQNFTNGVNYKHADCNGDGIVKLNDANVISNNFSYSQLVGQQGREGDPELLISFSEVTVKGGETIEAVIHLGKEGSPIVADIYGIAVIWDYNINPIKSIAADASNSWLKGSSGILTFISHDTINKKIHTVVSGIDQKNLTGSGEILKLKMLLPDSLLPSGAAGDSFALTPSYVKLIDVAQNEFLVYAQADWVPVYRASIQSKKPGTNLRVFPNPTAHLLNITSDNIIKEIKVYSSTGAEVHSLSPEGRVISIDTKTLPAGVYTVRVMTEQGLQSVKIIRK